MAKERKAASMKGIAKTVRTSRVSGKGKCLTRVLLACTPLCHTGASYRGHPHLSRLSPVPKRFLGGEYWHFSVKGAPPGVRLLAGLRYALSAYFIAQFMKVANG